MILWIPHCFLSCLHYKLAQFVFIVKLIPLCYIYLCLRCYQLHQLPFFFFPSVYFLIIGPNSLFVTKRSTVDFLYFICLLQQPAWLLFKMFLVLAAGCFLLKNNAQIMRTLINSSIYMCSASNLTHSSQHHYEVECSYTLISYMTKDWTSSSF